MNRERGSLVFFLFILIHICILASGFSRFSFSNDNMFSFFISYSLNLHLMYYYYKMFERAYRIEQAQLPPTATSPSASEYSTNEGYMEAMFNYAWACCRSPRQQDILQGIRLMKGKICLLRNLLSIHISISICIYVYICIP